MGKAYSRGQGEIAREGEQGSGYAGTDMGNTQVGGGHCTEAGYSGMEMGDAQVDGGPYAGADTGEMTGLGLGAAVDDDGDKIGDWGKGAGRKEKKAEVKKLHNNKRHSLRL